MVPQINAHLDEGMNITFPGQLISMYLEERWREAPPA